MRVIISRLYYCTMIDTVLAGEGLAQLIDETIKDHELVRLQILLRVPVVFLDERDELRGRPVVATAVKCGSTFTLDLQHLLQQLESDALPLHGLQNIEVKNTARVLFDNLALSAVEIEVLVRVLDESSDHHATFGAARLIIRRTVNNQSLISIGRQTCSI
jgi:hypothetical protein